MFEKLVRRVQVRRRSVLLLLGLFLLLGTPFVVGWLLVASYYSEKNLLMFTAPLAIDESGTRAEATVEFALPKGVYQCFLAITMSEADIESFGEDDELLVRCRFVVAGAAVRTEERVIPVSTELLREYVAKYQEDREMYLRTGNRVLPYPWTYMEQAVDGRMRFPLGLLNLDSHGTYGIIEMAVRSGTGKLDGRPRYNLRLERYIDAV